MNIAEIFIRRPVMTTLVMLAILIFGILGYRALPVSDLPNVDFPTISVSASLPGASPGDDGVFGGDAAGTTVLDHRGPGLDDLHQPAGQFPDHAPVQLEPRYRWRGARRASP